jgi:SAM-dependent methyltransferase
MPDDLIDEMNLYYRARAFWHDEYMSYTDNTGMEAQLAPIIEWVEKYVLDRDVLEIACGTGNWTQVLAKRVRSVLATDVNDSVIAIARKKEYKSDRVAFKVADAYTLEGIENEFTAAFAADWFSHVPKSRVVGFLKLLHGKLQPGAHVVLVDMLWRDHPDLRGYRYDEEGNLYHRRRLPDGQEFDVIKNYPTEEELYGYLEGIGEDIEYREHQELLRWMIAYRKS